LALRASAAMYRAARMKGRASLAPAMMDQLELPGMVADVESGASATPKGRSSGGKVNLKSRLSVASASDENQIRLITEQARTAREVTFRERYSIFMVCLPIALFSTLIGLTALMIRRLQLVPERYLAAIEHPYAAQVFGIVAGYLLIMRLNIAMTRWDAGMSSAQLMEAKWNDAYVQLIAFLECSKKKHEADAARLAVIVRAEQDLVHFFSMLHAVACINLYYGEGMSYGIMSTEGSRVHRHFVNVSFDDGSGRPECRKPLSQIKDPRPPVPEGVTMSKRWWPYNLAVLGDITQDEKAALQVCQRQTHLVFMWLQRLCATLINEGIVTIPPPIYSRVYQEMSNGMLGFMQAYKISVLPFPLPLTHMTEVLLVVIVVFIPFLVEKFTKALIFTPVFTFFSVFGMFVMHSVTMQLEMPFGDDYIDLPLREMHNAFNTSLLQNFVVPKDRDPLKHYRSTPFCDPNWMENSEIDWGHARMRTRNSVSAVNAAELMHLNDPYESEQTDDEPRGRTPSPPRKEPDEFRPKGSPAKQKKRGGSGRQAESF